MNSTIAIINQSLRFVHCFANRDRMSFIIAAEDYSVQSMTMSVPAIRDIFATATLSQSPLLTLLRAR